MEIISLWFSIAHLGYIAELLIVWTCRRRYCLANKLYMRCFKLLLLLWNEKEADRITLDLPQKKCVLSFSAYCPQDNVEEALLLLLISESMVSQKWACNTNSTKEYLVFPSQVFWLVLCTESSLDKEKQGFTAGTGNAIYSYISDTAFIKWTVSEGVWELSRRGSDCIHRSFMQVLTSRYIVSRQMVPFKTSVWIYGSRMRGREPHLKPGMMVVPVVWHLQDTISWLHSLVCGDNILAVSVLNDLCQFLMLMIEGVLSHAETSIMNYSEIIRFLLFITWVA